VAAGSVPLKTWRFVKKAPIRSPPVRFAPAYIRACGEETSGRMECIAGEDFARRGLVSLIQVTDYFAHLVDGRTTASSRR